MPPPSSLCARTRTRRPLVAVAAVLSRLAVLWGIVHVAPPAQVHWAFALMAISWSLVEVPRYVFYLWKLVSNSVPYWLLWVRYSLFIVLYPTGITGAPSARARAHVCVHVRACACVCVCGLA
ncbi:hypothetical protein EON66_05695 [archaeon]|nr:MAG: hypothetical protein EON66_05695 [archaeon]